jgi:predicted ATP-grasp superfamily ATP-dependent carboligase
VVVAGGFQTAVVLMRSLARRHLEVHAIHSEPDQPAFYTVYGTAHRCPDSDRQPGEWLDFMIDLSGQISQGTGRKPVLISSSDQYVTAIAEHAAALGPHFTFCQSSIATQALLATKKKQYAMAGDLGLPVPATRFVESPEDVREFALTATFPAILKPLHFREWKRIPSTHPLFEKKLIVVADAGELESQYLMAAKINPRMVVQEMIEGPDTAKLVYLSCYDRNSRRLASCMMRQIRTYPIGFGSASLVEPADDPETDRLCDEFLRKLQYFGLCEIELKRDTRDGRVKMIEANPRFSVTADAAVYAGVDLGWIHYLDLAGETAEPVSPDGRYFRHICLFRDVPCFHSYIEAGLLTWRGFFESYQGRVFFFDFDLHDPRVTFRIVVSLARMVAGSLIRSVFPGFRRHGSS